MSKLMPSLEELFYGSATLGERGQIVIPADARKACDMHPGDKVLVFRHPMHPRMLVLAKVGEMQQLMEQMKRSLDNVAERLAETSNAEEEQELTR